MQLENAIKTRKSVRKFSEKSVNWRKIIRAIDYARFAPFAGNLFNMKFVVIDDLEKIKSLAEASEQNFVGDVKDMVVVVSDEIKVKKLYGRMGEKFARQQAGAAIENFLLGLNEQKLSTCWIGYFDEKKVKKILKIKDDFVVEALFPIGVEGKLKVAPKYKTELESVLFFNEWENQKMKPNVKLSLDAY